VTAASVSAMEYATQLFNSKMQITEIHARDLLTAMPKARKESCSRKFQQKNVSNTA